MAPGGSPLSEFWRMKLWYQRKAVAMDFIEKTNIKNIILFSYLGALDWISQQGHP